MSLSKTFSISKIFARLFVLASLAAGVTACQTSQRPRAAGVEFTFLRRDPARRELYFRIINNTSGTIQLRTMYMSDDRPFTPPPVVERWDGKKWVDVPIWGDGVDTFYYLKPGQTVGFEQRDWIFDLVPKHAFIRLNVNGYRSEPFRSEQ